MHRRSRPLAAGLALLLTVAVCASCSESASPTTDADAGVAGDAAPDGPLPLPLAPFPESFVMITGPTGEPALTTDRTSLTLDGIAVGEMASLSYRVEQGGQQTGAGSIPLQGSWRADAVPLPAGDSLVTVTAVGKDKQQHQDSVAVTVNPGVALGAPAATPAELFVGDSTPVVFTLRIDSGEVDPAGVSVVEVGGAALTALTDDGAGPDTLAKDGIYSGSYVFTDTAEKSYQLRVELKAQAGAAWSSARSQPFSVTLRQPLAQAEVSELFAVDDLAQDTYFQHLAGKGKLEALRQAVTALEGQPHVVAAGVGAGGLDLWWTMDSGLRGMLGDYPTGTRGPTPAVEEARALLLGPFFTEFAGDEEVGSAAKLLQQPICPSYDPVDRVIDDQVTVEDFKRLYRYGVVWINSHGGYCNDNEICISTAQRVDEQAMLDPSHPYKIDGKAGRLVVSGKMKKDKALRERYYGIAPGFITEYNGRFPTHSLVYLGSCFGAANKSLSDAFLQKGAWIFMGFTCSVGESWGRAMSLGTLGEMARGLTLQQGLGLTQAKVGPYSTTPSCHLVPVPQSRDLALVDACSGYTRIVEQVDDPGSTGPRVISATRYSSADTIVVSPFDPSGKTFVMKRRKRSCEFEKQAFNSAQELMDAESGKGYLDETYLPRPLNPLNINPDARYGVNKLEVDRVAKKVKLWVAPEGAYASQDDWVSWFLWSFTSGAWTEKGTCLYYGAIDEAKLSGVNSYLELSGADVTITETHVKGSKGIPGTHGKATVEFYYELKASP